MPSLLTIPREIRDQIYDWMLSDTLPLPEAENYSESARPSNTLAPTPEPSLDKGPSNFPCIHHCLLLTGCSTQHDKSAMSFWTASSVSVV
jgi:hypothetical protein